MAEVDRNTGNPTSYINLVIGVWLFISAFVWPHTMGQQTNTWILGVLIALASAWALFTPSVRYLNTLFAIWLFISTLVIAHQNAGTMWNNLIAAIVVFVVSLVPARGVMATTGGRRPLHA